MTPDNHAPDSKATPIEVQTLLPGGLLVHTVAPTDEEVAAMVANFGNLPDVDFERPMKPAVAQPLQGLDIQFDGFDHQPQTYTLNFMDDTLWIERPMFFDDVKHLPNGRIPVPCYVFATVMGARLTDHSPEAAATYESALLRIDFEKDENGDSWASLVHLDAKSISTITKLELVLHIEKIEAVDGVTIDEETDHG